MTPYGLVVDKISKEPAALFFKVEVSFILKIERSSTQKMEANGSSEKLLAVYQTTLRHIPKGINLCSHR
jgi:hypothetical protein